MKSSTCSTILNILDMGVCVCVCVCMCVRGREEAGRRQGGGRKEEWGRREERGRKGRRKATTENQDTNIVYRSCVMYTTE